MIHGLALCSGIAGIDLGLHLALGGAYRTVCHVERDAYAAATLVARMEDKALDPAPVWDDLKTFDGRPWRGIVDIVTAGYPCQPFSLAGKRLGERDERHLWPDVLRIVQEVQPGICFFENVAAHLGMGYGSVERDLQGAGYRVACGIFSASEVGAPHKRERLFIMAHRRGERWQGHGEGGAAPGATGRSGGTEMATAHGIDDAFATAGGRNGAGGAAAGPGEQLATFPPSPSAHDQWRAVLAADPTLKPALCSVVNGIPDRVDQLRCSGNAVVPLVAAKAFVCLAAKLGIGNTDGA